MDDKLILKKLLEVKVTKGFWRSGLKIEGEEFEEKIKENNWTAEYFLKEEGKDILKKALKKYYKKSADKQYDNLCEFLFRKIENSNIIKWIEMALKNANIRKKVFNGYKSWMIFLRDAYDFKYIPIDIHERRFQTRTGIFHYYLGKRVHDPGNKKHYQRALKNFAKDFLSDIIIKDYNLGEKPGLVDKFIWLHCANKAKNICAKEPKCKKF